MMLLNITCFLIQLALLRKRFPKAWVLQLPAAVIFGWMTDFSNYLLSWFEPANYGMQLACLAAGIVLVAAGLSIEVSANTIMLSVDGLVKAIVMVTEKNFGKIKVGLDVTLVTLSIVCSFVLIGGIEGIREGTVLAACSRRSLPGSFLKGRKRKYFLRISRRRTPATEVSEANKFVCLFTFI